MPNEWSTFADIAAAESDSAWSQYLMDNAQSAYDVARDNSSVTIREVGAVTLNDLSAVIRGNGGQLITSASDPLVQSARGQWWKFSVDISSNGLQARITENNYLLYGGIGLAAVLVLVFVVNK